MANWISIHALREESDPPLSVNILVGYWFQSTLSARRATLAGYKISFSAEISIHALREESDIAHFYSKVNIIISIHALREESD